MSASPPVKKNEELTLFIEGLTAEGAGVARKEGFVLFVPGALPGELANVHVIKATAGYAVAKLLSLENVSPERVAPPCPSYAFCGGCKLQHLAYPAQLRLKRQVVIDAFARLGGLIDPPVAEPIGMADPFRYRNKGSFPIGLSSGKVCAGLYAECSHRLTPISDCPIQSERMMETLSNVTEWANAFGVAPYDERSKKGLLRHVTLRESAAGQMMAVVVTARRSLPHVQELIERLSEVDSLYQNVNARDTNVIFGPEFILLSGAKTISERIGGYEFAVSPQSFLQVNAVQTEVLYGAAVDLLDAGPADTVVDAYCGIGTISLLIARRAGRVVGVENVPEAVADAKENAEHNGVHNVDFICADAEEALANILAREKPAAMLADPPRKGMDPAAVRTIINSSVSRLVYVSCNPATLARDCRALSDAGFAVINVQPVDMFPHTGHVECVALLCREKP